MELRLEQLKRRQAAALKPGGIASRMSSEITYEHKGLSENRVYSQL